MINQSLSTTSGHKSSERDHFFTRHLISEHVKTGMSAKALTNLRCYPIQVSPGLHEGSTEGVRSDVELRNPHESLDDPLRGIKSVTNGVLVSPFLLAVLGAGGLFL